LVNYHVTALGHIKKPEMKKLKNHKGNLKDAYKGMRRVNFDELGFHEAAIYERDRLPVGVSVAGPAVIEEPASVTVVFPDQRLTRDEYGNLHIDMMN
jgi:N-methylhydantoinase A